MLEHHVTQKNTANKLRNRQKKKYLRRNKIHWNILELSHLVNIVTSEEACELQIY